MVVTRSAKKEIRASATKRVFNLRRTRTIKTILKEIKKMKSDGDSEGARNKVPVFQKAVDKAVKTNLIKKNKGSRMKSRLVAFLKKEKVA